MHKTLNKAILALSLGVGLVMAPSPLFAKICEVGKAGDFVKALENVQTGSSCKTADKDVREKYDKYRYNSLEFFVIRFKKSVEVTGPIPCISGHSGIPLILEAEEGILASILSQFEICVGGVSPAIISGVNFGGNVNVGGDRNALISSLVSGGVKISGNENRLDRLEVKDSSSNGIIINGHANKLTQVKVSNSREHGIFVTGHENKIEESTIFGSRLSGVTSANGAMISESVFFNNGEIAINVEDASIDAPVGVTGIPNFADWKVTGNVVRSKQMNLNAARVEVFLKEGPFLVSTENIDKSTGQFVVGIKKPIVVNGRNYENPVFVATVVDLERGVTSPFSQVPDIPDLLDIDGDGIPNDQEDYNHNGKVDFGETDPRNPDTDGDGLTDGEERLHIGRVGELLKNGRVFADLSKLDPTNPDSDGDCLNDGLELGVTGAASGAVGAQAGLLGSTSNFVKSELEVSSHCREILKKHGVTETPLFDIDPTTLTDPTNMDSDLDGLPDGEEDWNFNGARDSVSQNGGVAGEILFLETDPNLPDSDGDSLLDGSEGDKNHDGEINFNESDPLKADTDGDGVTDDYEILRMLSSPNNCDSDGDGLSDGIEAGAIGPNSEKPECSALQIAGTNFASIAELSAVTVDSDGDGLKDGDEDANRNGWLDFNETDPTTKDTDGDGISDYIETTLDTDGNGVSNINLELIDNGKKCSPPHSALDLDCDGVVNARDDDSDGDGCLDKDEPLSLDRDANGIPDVWEAKQANCSAARQTSSGSSSGSSASASAPAEASEAASGLPYKRPSTGVTNDPFGGGACSLVADSDNEKLPRNFSLLMIAFANFAFLIFARKNISRKAS